MRVLLTVVGFLVLGWSLQLGVFQGFNHFYELTRLGLLLILIPWVSHALTPMVTLQVYLACVAVALIGDLVVVLGITHLWHYTYTHVWEYVLLYLFVYSGGGLVMLASYLLLRSYFLPKNDNRRDFRTFFIIFGIVAVAAALAELYFRPVFSEPIWNLLFTATIAIVIGIPAAIYSEKRHRASFLRDIVSNPGRCALATSIATYPNLVLHEFPNIYARQ